MRLVDLDAKFLRFSRVPCKSNEWVDGILSEKPYRDYLIHVSHLADAHGVTFICPKSFAAHGGKNGAHHTANIWFEGSPVPPDVGLNKAGNTVRWRVTGGNSLENLTLAPSILEEDEACQWHGFVVNGDAS
jgi:hypothetical protein